MAYTYKCESCNSIGELEQLLPTVECPACGGKMRPMDAQGNINQPSSSLSSTNLGLVKVAKTVNLGFSGMIKSSGTGTGAFMPSRSMDSASGRTSRPFPDNTNSNYEMPRQEFDPSKTNHPAPPIQQQQQGKSQKKTLFFSKTTKRGPDTQQRPVQAQSNIPPPAAPSSTPQPAPPASTQTQMPNKKTQANSATALRFKPRISEAIL